MDLATRYLRGAVDAWVCGDVDLALELLNDASCVERECEG
jgi:hypothetical protein